MLKTILVRLTILLVLFSKHISSHKGAYTTYEELVSDLNELTTKHPNKTHLYSIGKSVEGRDLWVLAIANSEPSSHQLLRPEVKLIGNIHGNELPTGEILLDFIHLMLENPENDTRLDEILNTMRVHILVSMNPDGTKRVSINSCSAEVGHNNSNNFNLNRNFPDRFFCNDAPIQPETAAILNWIDSTRFLLSAKFNTGGVATTYPYENFPNSENAIMPKDTPTEDDDVFRFLAKKYALNHKTMPKEVCDGNQWQDGIINGANWLPPIRGGMEDVNYWKFCCYELTMEINCCLLPPASDLERIWDENKNALIEFTKTANTGIRGLISYKNGVPAQYLSVQFDSREPIFKTTELGEFYALLLPGNYTMTVMFNCNTVLTKMVVVENSIKPTVENITLDDRLYFRQFYYVLDKYALFCTKSKAPVDCSTGREVITTTTIMTTEPLTTTDHSSSSTKLSSWHRTFVIIFVVYISVWLV